MATITIEQDSGFRNTPDNPKSYQQSIGLMGLGKVMSDEKDRYVNERENYPPRSFVSEDMSMENLFEDVNVTISDDSIETLVDKMRSTVFEVSITNAMSEIIEPLSQRMELLHLEDRLEGLRNHNENMFYQQGIIDELKMLSDNMENSFIRTLTLEYKKFARHPVWYSLSQFVTKFALPLINTAGSILFGRKREKSDTDRIVESVNKLREFIMTGQIDQEKTFFQRLTQEGLLGMPTRALGRAVLSTTGISKKSAQQREENLVQGSTLREQNIVGNFRGFISDQIFGDEIIRKGKKGGLINQSRSGDNDYEQLSQMLADTFNDMDIFMRINEWLESQYSASTKIIDVINQSNAHLVDSRGILNDTRETLHRIEQFGYSQERMMRELHDSPSMVADSKLTDEIKQANMDSMEYQVQSNLDQKQLLESMVNHVQSTDDSTSRLLNINESMFDTNEDTYGIEKKQLRVQQRTRAAIIFGNIIRGIGAGINSLVKTLGSIAAFVTGGKLLTSLSKAGGIFGGKAAASKAGAGGILSKLKLDKVAKMGKFAKGVPVLGTLLAGAGAYGISQRDDITERQRKIEYSGLGGALAGGAGGAALGTMVGGPIGTIIGGVAGAIVGEEGIKAVADWIFENDDVVKQSTKETSMWEDFKTFFTDGFDSMTSWVTEKVEEFKPSVLSAFDDAFEWVKTVPEKIGNMFSSLNPFSSDDNGNEKSLLTKITDKAKSIGVYFDDLDISRKLESLPFYDQMTNSYNGVELGSDQMDNISKIKNTDMSNIIQKVNSSDNVPKYLESLESRSLNRTNTQGTSMLDNAMSNMSVEPLLDGIKEEIRKINRGDDDKSEQELNILRDLKDVMSEYMRKQVQMEERRNTQQPSQRGFGSGIDKSTEFTLTGA